MSRRSVTAPGQALRGLRRGRVHLALLPGPALAVPDLEPPAHADHGHVLREPAVGHQGGRQHHAPRPVELHLEGGRVEQALHAPRTTLSAYAPRIFTMKVKQDKIREIIGPGGKTIRGIIADCGVKINVDDSGTVTIASVDGASAEKAKEMISRITEEVEIGKIYMGTVRKLMDFGAFVEVLPGTDGLVHISQLAHHRVQAVSDEVKEGDQILVKVLEVDRQGKIRLSRKEAMPAPTGAGATDPSAR